MIQVVFAHGFWGMPEDWNFVIEHLQKESLSICNLSLYDWTESSSSQKLDSFQPSLNPELTTLFVGYSMGARLLMYYLSKNHSTWKKWKLLNFAGAWGQNPKQSFEERERWEKEWSEKFRTQEWQSLNEDWNAYDVFHGHKRIRREELYSREALSNMILHWSPRWQGDLRRFLSEQRANIQIYVGEKDEKYQALYEGFSPKILSAAGHRLLWEAQAACQYEVLSSLKSM